MANEQNLRTPTHDEAVEMQKKSVEARQRNKLIRAVLAEKIWEELEEDPSKLHEMARGIIERSVKNSGDLSVMTDIMDGKQKEHVAVDNMMSFTFGDEDDEAGTSE